jgi:sporulation-control protein spo0M
MADEVGNSHIRSSHERSNNKTLHQQHTMHFNKQAKEVLVIRFQDSDCRQCKQLQRQFRFQQKKTFNNTHHSVRKQYYSKILPHKKRDSCFVLKKVGHTHAKVCLFFKVL